jgi:hypothetical protein
MTQPKNGTDKETARALAAALATEAVSRALPIAAAHLDLVNRVSVVETDLRELQTAIKGNKEYGVKGLAEEFAITQHESLENTRVLTRQKDQGVANKVWLAGISSALGAIGGFFASLIHGR